MIKHSRNNDETRPRKTGAAKRRRRLEHRRRLIALGVSEEKVAKMNPTDIRLMLHNPKLISTIK